MRVSRLFNENDDIPVHSSTYAQVAYKKRIGSDTLQSFSQRQKLDKNRQVIKQYRESKIGSHERVHTEALSRNTAESYSSPVQNNNPRKSVQSARPAQPPRPSQGFREPSGRNFNPYS